MEIIELRKTQKNRGEISLKIADVVRKYEFSYFEGEIFAVDFPEELRRFLRLVPASITQTLIDKIKNNLKSESEELPVVLELEKEIFQMV